MTVVPTKLCGTLPVHRKATFGFDVCLFNTLILHPDSPIPSASFRCSIVIRIDLTLLRLQTPALRLLCLSSVLPSFRFPATRDNPLPTSNTRSQITFDVCHTRLLPHAHRPTDNETPILSVEMSDRSGTPEGDGRDGRSPLPDAGPAPIHASVAPKGHQVGLKLQDQSGYSIAFKVKSTTKFAKIMDTWANKVGVEKKALRFLFDGTRLVEDDTPGSVSGMFVSSEPGQPVTDSAISLSLSLKIARYGRWRHHRRPR